MIDLINKLKPIFHRMKFTPKDIKDIKKEVEPLFEKCGFREEIPNNPKIAIFMINGIGDAICASEAIIRIKEKYPESEITLFSPKVIKELYFACPLIDHYEEFNKSDYISEDLYNFFKLAFQNHYNIGYILSIEPYLYKLLYIAGINKIYGLKIDQSHPHMYWEPYQVQIPYQNLITKTYPVIKGLTFGEQLANMVIEKNNKFNLSLWITPNSLKKVEKYEESDNNIAIVISSNIKRKKYPYYNQVLNMFYEMNPNLKFFIFGGKQELEDEVFKNLLECKNVISLVGELSIHESIAMLSKCKYYIGNDTWLSHAAGALSMPSVVLMPYPANKKFHKYAPPIWMHPLNSPSVIVLPKTAGSSECMEENFYLGCCSGLTNYEDNICCIKNIKPETVIEAFKYLQTISSGVYYYPKITI